MRRSITRIQSALTSRFGSATAIPPYLAALVFVSPFLPCSATAVFAVGSYQVEGNVIENPRDAAPRGIFFETNDGSMEYDSVHGRMTVEDIATAHANADGLYVSAHSEIDGVVDGGDDGISGEETFATAWATWNDFVIAGPVGSGPINVSFNVHLNSPEPLQADEPDPNLLAYTQAETKFFAQSTELGYGVYTTSGGNIPCPCPPGSGLLAGFDGSGDITIPTFEAPVNKPFSVEFYLYATALVVGDSTSLANADYRLTFATDEPVFNLPFGYTVNALDANIESNAFVVPEPSSVWIVVMAGTIPKRRSRNR